MPWNELAARRNRTSRAYQDTLDPRKIAWDGGLASLHYETELDSGVYDRAIDATPVRVNNAALDGWTVSQNGWHYALGMPKSGTGANEDGWVGFGGRQGQNWLRFRLLRLGYLRWSTRAWQDIGGAPSYNRANLTSETHTTHIPTTGEELPIESVATWNDLWTTPGGGSVSASWRVNGDQLKEEITVNAAARAWVQANRPPTTPAAQTWFGMVFRVDWADVPRAYRASVLQNVATGDFADDGQPLELRDALDRFLALLPVDDVRVPNADPTQEVHAPLRKRFWRDADGNTYLLVGVLCSTLAGMPAGDLVFDPTLDLQVGAGAYDGYGLKNDSFFSYTGASCIVRNDCDSGLMFLAGVPQGATIDVAYITLKANSTSYDDVNCSIYGENVDNAASFAANGDIVNRARTATPATWVATGLGTDWVNTPSVVTPLQDVVDRAGYTDASYIDLILVGNTGSSNQLRIVPYETSTTDAAKLHIEYTAGGGGEAVAFTPRRALMGVGA